MRARVETEDGFFGYADPYFSRSFEETPDAVSRQFLFLS